MTTKLPPSGFTVYLSRGSQSRAPASSAAALDADVLISGNDWMPHAATLMGLEWRLRNGSQEGTRTRGGAINNRDDK